MHSGIMNMHHGGAEQSEESSGWKKWGGIIGLVCYWCIFFGFAFLCLYLYHKYGGRY